jgi:HEPN domain-containing protein
MKQPIDLARKFLAVADNDIKAFQKLADDSEIADASVGFHAQQAVEKCLKAVLALHSIKFRKKHDLGELLDLYEQNKLPLPPMMDVLDELNPYAVTLRYDLLDDIEALNRERTKEIVNAVRQWAGAQVNGPFLHDPNQRISHQAGLAQGQILPKSEQQQSRHVHAGDCADAF